MCAHTDATTVIQSNVESENCVKKYKIAVRTHASAVFFQENYLIPRKSLLTESFTFLMSRIQCKKRKKIQGQFHQIEGVEFTHDSQTSSHPVHCVHLSSISHGRHVTL